MLTSLYVIVGGLEVLIYMILVAKYIFLERGFQHNRNWYIYGGMFLLASLLAVFVNPDGDINILLTMIFFIIYIVFTREKRRIRGIFLVLPVSGMIFTTIIIPSSIYYLFYGSMKLVTETNSEWMIGFDVVFWVCFIVFLWKCKKWRMKFNEIAQYRSLSKWERNLLNAIGTFFFLFSLLIYSIDQIQIGTIYAKCFVAGGIFIIIFLEGSIIAMVMQGNKKTYFENAAIVNEYYLKAQLRHFQAYQQTQKETRRIHHDMKNHIICLYNLINQEKYEDAQRYIIDMNRQVQYVDQELHTGNYIVDAILNEKNEVAKRANIEILIEGRLGELNMDAIDICTIFSNALDNAIEALLNSQILKKQILLDMRKHNSIQYIKVQNQIEKGKFRSGFFTAKSDYINHGFGLGNIRMAVEKYRGQIEYKLDRIDHQDYFVLQIVLFA